jgi:hypothetical protein
MEDEYDFSKAVQGKFYRPLESLEIPVYLDPGVKEYYARKAREQNMRPEELINSVLKENMSA